MADPRTQLDAFLGTRPVGTAQAREPQEPLRLLVLADLGGSDRAPLAQRKPVGVDVDSFEDLFARGAALRRPASAPAVDPGESLRAK